MISLYRFGQFLALLQICYSQCFDPFDPKTLIVSNYENSSRPGFNLSRNADLSMCMMICFKFKLCRSVDWIKDKKICRLNTRFDQENDSSLMTNGLTLHVEKDKFPVHLAGNCLNNVCAEDAICFGGKCIPVLKGWTRFGDSEYWLGKQKVKWTTASEECKMIGGKLVEMESSSENNFVRMLAQNLTESVWLGATDREVEGQWRWADNNSLLTFSDWDVLHNQPNNYNNQDCLSLYLPYGLTWCDESCDNRDYQYICERDAV